MVNKQNDVNAVGIGRQQRWPPAGAERNTRCLTEAL
jgi:hypothetical protein